MDWRVPCSNKARKQKEHRPPRVRALLFQLEKEIVTSGPLRGDWPNYANLAGDRHHCHLKRGNPAYVAGARGMQRNQTGRGDPSRYPRKQLLLTRGLGVRLRVHRHNAPPLKPYAGAVEAGEERTSTFAEVFSEEVGKEQQIALRAFRTRENLTQKQLAEALNGSNWRALVN